MNMPDGYLTSLIRFQFSAKPPKIGTADMHWPVFSARVIVLPCAIRRGFAQDIILMTMKSSQWLRNGLP